VVDGGLKLAAGTPLNVKPLAAPGAASTSPPASKPAPKPAAAAK
jgi:hypothetical protein